jgi:hypothetical protein
MSEQPAIAIMWHGRETVPYILDQLRPATDIELQLAEGYHHALFRTLYPDAPPSQPEELDAEGGAELLRGLDEINGLEGMEGLIAPLRHARARIHISGRAKIAISVPADGGDG